MSVAAWGFLESVHYITQWVWDDLPDALGFDATPVWWGLPVYSPLRQKRILYSVMGSLESLQMESFA